MDPTDPATMRPPAAPGRRGRPRRPPLRLSGSGSEVGSLFLPHALEVAAVSGCSLEVAATPDQPRPCALHQPGGSASRSVSVSIGCGGIGKKDRRAL
jgi:hypothetical protein